MRLRELARLFAANGLTDSFVEQEALFRWSQVVGERTARLTKPLYVNEGVLYVQVGTHVFAQEYTLMREEWIKRLNGCLSKPLRDIRFKVSAIAVVPEKRLNDIDPDDVELDEAELADTRDMVSMISDKRIRRSMQKLIEAHKKLQKFKSQQAEEKQCPGCGLYHDSVEALCAHCRLERKTP